MINPIELKIAAAMAGLGGNGSAASASSPVGGKRPLTIMPTDDITFWDSDNTAGLVVSVDNSVLFGGKPTIKVVIPSGTSGAIKIGTSGATGKGNPRVPYNWDAKLTGLAFRSTNSALFQSGYNLYLGDSTYTNFWAGGLNATHYGSLPASQQWFADNEWWCVKNLNALGVTPGTGSTISSTTVTRGKITMNLASATTQQETLWIGMVAALPKRSKPTVIITLDDGFASWYSYVYPRAKYYDIPVSMGIVTRLTNKPNYLTTQQIQTMFNDPSMLFDIVTHEALHDDLGTQGLAQYIANLNEGRDFLRSIGITGDGPLHHPWVESIWNNDGITALKANGYLSARVAGYAAEYGKDQMLFTGDDKRAYFLNSTNPLNALNPVSLIQSDINTAVTDNNFIMVLGHDFVKSNPTTYQWTYDSFDQLLDWLATQRDAGNIEIKSWTRWFADATGRQCNRR